MTRANLKQRIAGGAVLIIVLAIFLPFLFSHSNVQQAPIEKPVVVSMNEVADQSSELIPTPVVMQTENQIQGQEQEQEQEQAENQHQDPLLAQVETAIDNTADNQSPPVIVLEENAPIVMRKPQPQPKPISKPNTQNRLPQPAMSSVHWVVQVASFTESTYAKRLLAHLQEQGIRAYIRQEPNRLIRVFVGPVATKEQAEELQQRIKDQFRLNGIVRRQSA